MKLTTHLSTPWGWKAELAFLADLQRMVYPYKWLPISCRSGADQWKFACQRPTFYHWANPINLAMVMKKQTYTTKDKHTTKPNKIKLTIGLLWQPARKQIGSINLQKTTALGAARCYFQSLWMDKCKAQVLFSVRGGQNTRKWGIIELFSSHVEA